MKIIDEMHKFHDEETQEPLLPPRGKSWSGKAIHQASSFKLSVMNSDGEYKEISDHVKIKYPTENGFSGLRTATENAALALNDFSKAISIDCQLTPNIFLTKRSKRGRFGLKKNAISKNTSYLALIRALKAIPLNKPLNISVNSPGGYVGG